MSAIKRLRVLALLLGGILAAQCASAQSVWRSAYVEDPTSPSAANFPYLYYTHIILVGFNCNGSGTLYNQYGYPTNLWPGFRTNATANGVKVLLFLGGDMTSCTNSTNLAAYVTRIKNTVLGTDTSLNTGGVVFDGVDLDWEAGIGTGSITAYENLISGLRTALGSTKIIEMAGWRASFFQTIAVNQQANLDRFQNEMYDATSGASNGSSQLWSWYNVALHNLDSPPNFSGSMDGGFNGLVGAGFPASKINEGIPYYGYLYTGCTHSEVVGCTSVSGTQYSYAAIQANATRAAAPHLNDARNGADYIPLSGTNQYVTYSDVTSIGQVVSWGKSVGLGGYFVWTQGREYIPSGATLAQKFPLSAALFTASSASGFPVISSFTASPASIFPGSSSTLSWSTTGATSLSIDRGVGTVTGTSTSVSPSVTTIYTLTASNSAGSVTRAATVTVTAPTISSFSASPTTVTSGGLSTLSWITSGATSCAINQGVGTVTCGTSSVGVHPTANTTYTLTATNSVGSTPSTATVTVTTAPHSACALILQ